ncbi:MAG: hypothetical protein ING33_00630 [Rhodocyclaceae bacterium]|nr:hypothetical protein [Rhodocyclaceae bacterium]MCA3061812.1 hypothetical protein [Rhodocyclaceae bacterium]MCA3082583.1 hypothetical protein [Rhodocyclaceae bacterium]
MPEVETIERITQWAVVIQIQHGQAEANVPGLKPKEADPDHWGTDDIIEFITPLVASISLTSGAEIPQGLRKYIESHVVERRNRMTETIQNIRQETWEHYKDEMQAKRNHLTDVASNITDHALGTAALCNVARALRRAGDIVGATEKISFLRKLCREQPACDPDGYVIRCLEIEDAWMSYLCSEYLEQYELCERKLLEFNNNTTRAKYDSRLQLEYHLIAALCARRRVGLNEGKVQSETSVWVRRSFSHFNAALRLCLLSEDRELQVHTIATLGDAVWDFGKQGVLPSVENQVIETSREGVAMMALRIVGASMRIARLGGANSGRFYATAYILRILSESNISDRDFEQRRFTHLNRPLTIDGIRAFAYQSLQTPGLSHEARARLTYGLSKLEHRMNEREKAGVLLSGLLTEAQNAQIFSQRMQKRVRDLAIEWGLLSYELRSSS